MAVSFIDGGNCSTRRKPLNCPTQVTDKLYHNIVLSTPHHEQDSNLTGLVVIGTDLDWYLYIQLPYDQDHDNPF